MPPTTRQTIGRYELRGQIASGGMATVHYGRVLGAVGFSRTVAVKRLHPQYAKDPEFVSMFLDEARLAARVRHPNVIATLDVEALGGELFLVMEYVEGEAFSRLLAGARDAGTRVPRPVVSSVMAGVLHGLHAAHEATSERGEPLGIVHRDVSPQNMLVGVDGVARVLDFGVAKAAVRVQTTREGQIKGKLSYMAPEQLRAARVDRRSDVYAAAVVLWEALTGDRLFGGDDAGAIVTAILHRAVPAPSASDPTIPPELDAVVLRGLAREPDARFGTAREMAIALEAAAAPAAPRAVGEFVERTARDALARRQASVGAIENVSVVTDAVAPAAAVPAPAPASATDAAPAEPTTAVYTASSDTPASIRPTAKRRAAAALGVVAAMGVASIGTLMVSRLLDGPGSTAPTEATTVAPAATATATAAEPVAATAAPAAATEAEAEAQSDPPRPSAAAEPAPVHPAPRAARPARPPEPAKTPASTSTSAAPRPECNPGYYFDDQGLKVWRAECFPKK